MKLHKLLDFEEIVIQCHDNPDADALASGYAVYQYLKEHDKQVRFIYSGRHEIKKSNLVLMIRELKIPIEYVTTLEPPELLVMIDCQYGEGNVTRFEYQNLAVLDHHRVCSDLPKLSEVRSSLGACSTLIWHMLKEEGYDANKSRKLATALYYGLYKDTNGLAEIYHPLDKDLRDEARVDKNLIELLRNTNLSMEDLEIAGTALLRSDYMEDYRCTIVKAAECDPNILGIISDFILEVDAVDVCIVFNVAPEGVKLSVRSCVKEVQASEFAEEICKGIGSGGGHFIKAGGFIPMVNLIPEYNKYCAMRGITPRMVKAPDGKTNILSNSSAKSVLENRIVEYFENSEIIYSSSYAPYLKDMKEYRKCAIPMGYVKATELFEFGTEITVRTMKGDIDTVVEDDTMILVSSNGDVSLVTQRIFDLGYRGYDRPYHLRHEEYNPTVKASSSGRSISLLDHVKVCIPTGSIIIRAKELDHNVKVFGAWDDSKYVKGSEGDYLFVRENDVHDIFIVDSEMFHQSYEPVEVPVNKGIEAVVFDLDGTLLDTLQDLTNAVNAALCVHDFPERTLEEVRQFVGNGVATLIKRAIPQGEANPKFEQVLRAFKEYYAEHCKDNTAPYPDILMVMEELQHRGIKIAIVSNKIDSAVKELNQEFFAEYASVAIGETPTVARKPASDMIDKALDELGVSKEHALYVGDSDVDIMTAKNAGIPCVSITWGFCDAEFLQAHGATQLIDRPIDLLINI